MIILTFYVVAFSKIDFCTDEWQVRGEEGQRHCTLQEPYIIDQYQLHLYSKKSQEEQEPNSNRHNGLEAEHCQAIVSHLHVSQIWDDILKSVQVCWPSAAIKTYKDKASSPLSSLQTRMPFTTARPNHARL